MTFTTLLSTYNGALTDAALNAAASAAWGYLLGQTLGRITAVETADDRLKQCFAALIDLISRDESALKSETVGDFRREYRENDQSQLQRAAVIISQYLGDTDLLYRGLEP